MIFLWSMHSLMAKHRWQKEWREGLNYVKTGRRGAPLLCCLAMVIQCLIRDCQNRHHPWLDLLLLGLGIWPRDHLLMDISPGRMRGLWNRWPGGLAGNILMVISISAPEGYSPTHLNFVPRGHVFQYILCVDRPHRPLVWKKYRPH